MTTEEPTITVDRAIGHYFSDLTIDISALCQFYDELPHTDKPSLADCRIFISAVAVRRRRMITRGLYRIVRDAESGCLQKIGAPQDTNLVIFVGSILFCDEPDKSKAMNEVLCHELTHHAQYGAPAEQKQEASQEEQLAQAQLFLATRLYPALRIILASGSFLLIAALLFSFSTYAMFGGLLTTNLLTHFSGRKRRKERIRQLEKKLHELYRKNDHESDAFQHAKCKLAIAKTEPRETEPDLLHMSPGDRVTTIDRMSRTIRQGMALKPPGTLKRAN